MRKRGVVACISAHGQEELEAADEAEEEEEGGSSGPGIKPRPPLQTPRSLINPVRVVQ